MHKLVCEGLKSERKFGKKAKKLNKEYMTDPEKRAIYKNINRMEGNAPDFDPYQDETRKYRLNGILESTSYMFESNNLWERIKAKKPAKQAKKVLDYLTANHDRRHVQFNTYADLYEKHRDVWNIIFDNQTSKRRFLEILADSIELDTKTLLNLPVNANEDDVASNLSLPLSFQKSLLDLILKISSPPSSLTVWIATLGASDQKTWFCCRIQANF